MRVHIPIQTNPDVEFAVAGPAAADGRRGMLVHQLQSAAPDSQSRRYRPGSPGDRLRAERLAARHVSRCGGNNCVTGERRFAWALLCVVLVVNAIALSAELRVGRITGNDNVSHLALVKGMARAVENGENPLDFWSPEVSFGSAPIRTYQPLAHALVVLVYFALGKTVSLLTVFVWIRYLSIVLLPGAFFAAALLLERSAAHGSGGRIAGAIDFHRCVVRPGLQQLRVGRARPVSSIRRGDPAAAGDWLRFSSGTPRQVWRTGRPAARPHLHLPFHLRLDRRGDVMPAGNSA